MARAATLPKDPEIRELAVMCWAQKSWEVVPTGSGHWKVLTPSGAVIMPSTPSDSRSVANVAADLKRAGLEIRRTDKVRKTGLGRTKPAGQHIPRNVRFDPKRFAEALIATMKERNWTQDRMAQELDVSGPSISLWRRGLGRPSLDTLLKIQQTLGWADYYGKPQPPPEPEPEPELELEVVEGNGEHPVEPIDQPELPAEPELLAVPAAHEQTELPYFTALGAINQLAREAKDNRVLRTENARLREQVSRLPALEDRVAYLQEENERLRRLQESQGKPLTGVKVKLA